MCRLAIVMFVLAASSGAVSSDGGGVVHSVVVRLLGKSDHVEERLPQCGERPLDCDTIDSVTFLFQENLLLWGKSRCLTETFELPDTKLGTHESNSLSVFKQIVRNFCRKSPALLQCFQEANQRAASCVCAVVTDIDSPSLPALSKLMDVVCSPDGGKLTRIVAQSGEEFWTQKQQNLSKCLKTMKQQAGVMNLNKKLLDPKNLPRVLNKNYKRNRNFRQCVLASNKPHGDIEDLIASFMDVMLEDFRCFKKKSRTLTPCSQVVRGGSQCARPALQSGLEMAAFWLVLTWISSATEINISSLT